MKGNSESRMRENRLSGLMRGGRHSVIGQQALSTRGRPPTLLSFLVHPTFSTIPVVVKRPSDGNFTIVL
jgi:hypothetical protein